MSLDVYLNRTQYLSYDKGKTYTEQEEQVYCANITHNLSQMASASGIYDLLWNPIESGYKKAEDIAYKLDVGIQELKSNPNKYKEFDSPNGWGTYKQFLPWLDEYLDALKENPDALITISK